MNSGGLLKLRGARMWCEVSRSQLLAQLHTQLLHSSNIAY